MKINEIIDNSISFSGCNFKPGDVFYYEDNLEEKKSRTSYYIVTDLHDTIGLGTPCINLRNGQRNYFSSYTRVVPCCDVELSLRR